VRPGGLQPSTRLAGPRGTSHGGARVDVLQFEGLGLGSPGAVRLEHAARPASVGTDELGPRTSWTAHTHAVTVTDTCPRLRRCWHRFGLQLLAGPGRLCQLQPVLRLHEGELLPHVWLRRSGCLSKARCVGASQGRGLLDKSRAATAPSLVFAGASMLIFGASVRTAATWLPVPVCFGVMMYQAHLRVFTKESACISFEASLGR